MIKQISFFKRAKELESKFNDFLLNITTAGAIFNQAIEVYLTKQANTKFLDLKEKISALEAENDMLRRNIETDLYRQMILPGMRSEILELMEACDHVINQYERAVIDWSIEKIKTPADLFENVMLISQTTSDCVGALVTGVKAFFDGATDVDEEVQQCYYLEHVVDQMALAVKSKIFKKKISLAEQLQLKSFIASLEKISDLAEDAADKLKIISVKHAL